MRSRCSFSLVLSHWQSRAPSERAVRLRERSSVEFCTGSLKLGRRTARTDASCLQFTQSSHYSIHLISTQLFAFSLWFKVVFSLLSESEVSDNLKRAYLALSTSLVSALNALRVFAELSLKKSVHRVCFSLPGGEVCRRFTCFLLLAEAVRQVSRVG